MEEAVVTAATGALGPVIAKLAALLGSEYKLRWRTRRDVKYIRSKLKPVHSLLWDTWEKEDLDAASRALKMEALDLADDMEDAIDDFILSMEGSPGNKRFIQTKINERPFQDLKIQANYVSRRCGSRWKKKRLSSLLSGKFSTDSSSPGKPRAYPFVRKDTSELVALDGPRDKLVEHLVGKDESAPVQLQFKTASIFGTAGMGKTTLAHLVYDKIEERFQARAFVTLTPGGSIKEVLASILEQVQAHSNIPLAAGPRASREEQLINIISNFLKDKRYLVIIDDIWNLRECEIIMKSLPMNHFGSRVVRTTRMNAVAKKWRGEGSAAFVHDMLHKWDTTEGWVYKIGEENIATRMIAMKADLVADGFNDKHPIVHMCGGTPLAVHCMLLAVAQEREKQGQQAKTCDVQDKIEKHVKENGMQNTPGYEPLVESLQLSYDDLPHHTLKTCLLYCSIYPDGHTFDRNDLVRLWISEGFVYEEEEANGYFEELVNRGLILITTAFYRMHPMMRNFLRWKSCQDGFTTCSSEITSSYGNGRIRRLCIDNSPCGDAVDEADPLSVLDWHHIRSLVVCEGIKRVSLEKLERLRVLDLCWIKSVQDLHLKDICGLVRLRHLLGLDGGRIRETLPEIVRLQCLETFQVSGSGFARLGFIGILQQLKTLEMRGREIKELPRDLGALQQLKTLRIRGTSITELPKDIGALQNLKILDLNSSIITQLPKEIRSLQQLEHLDMSTTWIRELPKEIGELQQLKTLDISRTRTKVIPKEIGGLKKLKFLKLDDSIVALPLDVCQVSALLVELPKSIQQTLKMSGPVSELAGERLSFKISGGLVVGAGQIQIPPWIKKHFNDLSLLDIRICKLEEEGLKILREMSKLQELRLRFQVVPREPVVISSEGFTMLMVLTVDSRVPRVTFQEGAMPMLQQIIFQFQFFAGPPNTGPVGINHLRSLKMIEFKCNEDWYRGGDSPCIGPTIDVVRKEAQELSNRIVFDVSSLQREILGDFDNKIF